jgi:hypothetical protein
MYFSYFIWLSVCIDDNRNMKPIMSLYRTSFDFDEILKILELSRIEGKNLLWQSILDERKITEIDEISFDLKARRVSVVCKENAELLDAKKDVYVKLAYKETVFKGKILKFRDKRVIISIPEEIKTQELRTYPRIRLSLEDEFAAQFSPFGPHSLLSATARINVRIVDISENGLGLIVSDKNRRLFKIGNDFWLAQIGEVSLPNKIIAKVVYNKAIKKSEFRVGVRLSASIPFGVFSAFLETITFHYHRDMKAAFSHIINPGFQKNVAHEIARRFELFKKAPHLGSIFLKFEQKVPKDSYLFRHIETLIYVMSVLYKCLNGFPESILDKIVYLAFVHDAPYFDNLKLAELKNLADFKTKRPQLSINEQLLYLEGPFLSSELAESDPLSPLDVSKILLESKEQPNGKGFPSSIKGDDINVMSALFIISHDLTDYILENPRWLLSDFIKKTSTKYDSGEFKKVFEAVLKLKQILSA